MLRMKTKRGNLECGASGPWSMVLRWFSGGLRNVVKNWPVSLNRRIQPSAAAAGRPSAAGGRLNGARKRLSGTVKRGVAVPDSAWTLPHHSVLPAKIDMVGRSSRRWSLKGKDRRAGRNRKPAGHRRPHPSKSSGMCAASLPTSCRNASLSSDSMLGERCTSGTSTRLYVSRRSGVLTEGGALDARW